tara:strand:+ start:7411 stop:8001 length:591 start_codon:yes stop_codon:yes gene_type:complete
MDFIELKNALRLFGKTVVANSKKRLDSNSPLAKSIKFELKDNPQSLEMDFLMKEYGLFHDQGVRGKDPSRVSKNARIKGQQGVGRDIVTGQFKKSPYKFGSGRGKGTFKDFTKAMEKFARKKNIRFRDTKGKFAKTNFKSLGYIIASNIYNRGLRGSLFFTDPFMKAFKDLPKDIEENFALDIEKFFDFSIKNINK